MKRYRLLAIAAFFFIFGFLVHALFFPDFISSGLGPISANSLPFLSNANNTVQTDEFINYIDYDGQAFNPNRITLKKGYYVAITNKSKDKLMWLFSDYDILNTERGYGFTERLQVLLSTPGEYTVIEKSSPQRKLTIVVK